MVSIAFARSGLAWLAGAFLASAAAAPASAQPAAQTAAYAAASTYPDRPQTPKPPFPYTSEEVAFDSTPGVRLAGTLTLPKGPGPFPVALLIVGSGPHDRDETIFGHKPFLVLADDLTRRGIAVLRYDKRGAGGSTGRSPDVTTADFAVDARAAVAFLRTRTDIDPSRVGLIGHSEGGAIAPMVAADDPKIAFVVMMAGPGVPGDELLVAQNRAILKAAGGSEAALTAAEQANRRIYEIVKSQVSDAEAEAQVQAILVGLGQGPLQARAGAAQAAAPWIRWWLRYDPRPALTKLRCPVLAIDGSKDLQVVAAQNLPEIRKALKDDPDATVIELPGLNHLFQTAGTGAASEYAQIPETIAPIALTTIGDWVVAHTKR
jgi:pimeloyl-ACP methyl ester carboxylesterase